MGRKAAVTLKTAKLKMLPADALHLAALTKMEFEPACEDEWVRVLVVAKRSGEANAREAAIFAEMEKRGQTGSDDKMWPALQKALADSAAANRAEMGALEMYDAAVRKLHAVKEVDDGDLRAVVQDAMRGALDGMQLTLNLGLLASKIAQSIKGLVREMDYGEIADPPYCQGCSA